MTQEAVEKADKSWKKNKKAKVWRKAVKKYEKNPANAKKISAKHAVKYAVKTGKLKKPKNCSRCGKGGVRIIADHRDYNSPLKVIWLCDICHSKTPERRGSVIGPAVKRSLAKKKRS